LRNASSRLTSFSLFSFPIPIGHTSGTLQILATGPVSEDTSSSTSLFSQLSSSSKDPVEVVSSSQASSAELSSLSGEAVNTSHDDNVSAHEPVRLF